MEWLRRMKLKKALFAIAFLNITIALILSLLAIWGLVELRSYFAADGIGIIMDAQSEQVMVRQIQEGSTEEETAAGVLSVVQTILPIVIYICALFLSASMFYRLKLREPIEALTKGAARIIGNDLDFEMEAGAEDELGQLCTAFETMRKTLLANNRELWRQAEERRKLNAAFAHDLRNPVTVLKGSVKLAKKVVENDAGDVQRQQVREEQPADTGRRARQGEQAQQREQAGQQGEQAGQGEQAQPSEQAEQRKQLAEHLQRIEDYTDRIGQYVETMSGIQKLEEITVRKEPAAWNDLMSELEQMVRLVGADSQKEIHFQTLGLVEKAAGDILVDKAILFQIAENLVANAMRFATQKITAQCSITGGNLAFTVSDDGCGFPEKLLQNGIQPFQKGTEEAGHFGMGLYLCELLCKKHGGNLTIQNIPTTQNSQMIQDNSMTQHSPTVQNSPTGATVCAVIKIQ